MYKKINKKIKLNNKTIAILIYKKNDKEINKIIKIIQDKYHELESFFNLNIPTVNIELIYSREEINDKYGHKTPNWMIGFVNKKNKNYIYIASPSICEKISAHKKNVIYKVIIHELSHIFINKINKNTLDWLNEGLALYLASQIKKTYIKKENWNFLIKNKFFTNTINLSTFAEHQGYEISSFLVNFLIKKYGKNKAIELIKINKKSKLIKKKFYKIFGIELEVIISQIKKQIDIIK